MASLVDLENEKILKMWGLRDAEKQTEALQHLRRSAGRYEFITKGKKRNVKPATYSLQEHAITSHVMRLVSRPNTATLLLENVNYASACIDFRRLIVLVNDYQGAGQSDLATLIFPVFVYFYLLLLQSGPYGRRDAQLFFKKNKKILAQEKSYTEVLKILHSFRNWADVKLHFYFKNFLDCKYIIGLPGEVLCYLKSFMENQAKEKGDKALLYVLHFHIYFQDNDEADYIEKVTGEMPTFQIENEIVYQKDASDYVIENRVDTQGNVAQMKDAKDDNAIVLDEAIEEISDTELEDLLNKLSLNIPLISTVVTKCVGSNITCVDFNDDDTEIAYAVGKNFIYTSALKINVVQTKCPLDEDSDEITPKKKRLEEERIEIPPPSPPPQIIGATSPLLQRKKTSSQRKKASSQRKKASSQRKKAKYEKVSKSARKLKSSKKVPRCEESSSEVSSLKKIEIPEGDVVKIIKYLPENPDVLLAVSENKVRLLETKSGSLEAQYAGTSSILDIDVNSTSKYFASATLGGVAQLYSFLRNTPIQSFVGHENPVTAVKFHPNGIYIATGSKDSLRLFDIDSGLCVRLFFGYNSDVQALSFSFDGKWLSSGDSRGIIKVWDIKDGCEVAPEICFSKEIETLGRIGSLCFGADSFLLMACNRKGECKLWDPRDSGSLQQLNFRNIPLKIKCCKDGVWKIAFQETL